MKEVGGLAINAAEATIVAVAGRGVSIADGIAITAKRHRGIVLVAEDAALQIVSRHTFIRCSPPVKIVHDFIHCSDGVKKYVTLIKRINAMQFLTNAAALTSAEQQKNSDIGYPLFHA